MALSFIPQLHTEVQSGQWVRVINQLAPFGRYPSIEDEQKASAEAKRIEAEGGLIFIADFKH